MTILILKTVLITAIVCVFVTLLHEAGHYLFAELLGLKPDKFILGRWGKTIYDSGRLAITAIPMSGAVYFEDNRLANAAAHQRQLIALGGPTVNIIIGVIALGISSDPASLIGTFGFVSVITGLGNLIPVKTAKVQSDGSWLFSPLRRAL